MLEIIKNATEPKAVEILLSLLSILWIIKEYYAYKRREEANVLSSFNQRYSTDKNIQAVVEYLMMYEDIRNKKGFTYPMPSPTPFQKELFLRFFEELQIAIENKSLPKDKAYDMFAHYALEADKELNFVADIKDDCWKRFHSFINEMKKIEIKNSKHPKN